MYRVLRIKTLTHNLWNLDSLRNADRNQAQNKNTASVNTKNPVLVSLLHLGKIFYTQIHVKTM